MEIVVDEVKIVASEAEPAEPSLATCQKFGSIACTGCAMLELCQRQAAEARDEGVTESDDRPYDDQLSDDSRTFVSAKILRLKEVDSEASVTDKVDSLTMVKSAQENPSSSKIEPSNNTSGDSEPITNSEPSQAIKPVQTTAPAQTSSERSPEYQQPTPIVKAAAVIPENTATVKTIRIEPKPTQKTLPNQRPESPVDPSKVVIAKTADLTPEQNGGSEQTIAQAEILAEKSPILTAKEQSRTKVETKDFNSDNDTGDYASHTEQASDDSDTTEYKIPPISPQINNQPTAIMVEPDQKQTISQVEPNQIFESVDEPIATQPDTFDQIVEDFLEAYNDSSAITHELEPDIFVQNYDQPTIEEPAAPEELNANTPLNFDDLLDQVSMSDPEVETDIAADIWQDEIVSEEITDDDQELLEHTTIDEIIDEIIEEDDFVDIVTIPNEISTSDAHDDEAADSRVDKDEPLCPYRLVGEDEEDSKESIDIEVISSVKDLPDSYFAEYLSITSEQDDDAEAGENSSPEEAGEEYSVEDNIDPEQVAVTQSFRKQPKKIVRFTLGRIAYALTA